MVKAIFLDIDGVICCNQFGRLEDRKLQLLRQVVQQTGAKIVLSTDWRRVPKLKSQLIATLRDYGMEVIGSTPMRAPWQPVRPQEIVDWLTSYNNAAVMGNGDPITSFVAVDDRSLLQESGGDGLRGRFVHTRNISGLTEKCAQRMAQVLISGGDGDAPPVHGLPMDQQQQGVGGGVGGGGGQSGAGMAVGSPLMKDHAAHRATPPSTAQVRRTAGGSLFAGGYDHGGAPAPASPLGLSALQGTSVGAGADPMGGSRSPAPHGHYIGGTPGMGGFSGGGGGMGHLGTMGGPGGMMSPIQRSIFRGGHDATGGTNRMVPGGSQQPISSPQIRGHTAAGGRISIGGSGAFGSHPFGGATPGHQAFDGSRLPQVRTAAGTATRTPPRSQTASVGFGRPQPPYYSQGGRQSMPTGSGSAVPNHLRPPSLRGMSL